MTPKALLEPARFAGLAVLRCQPTDRLIDMVRAGNDRAFEVIVERYRGPLLRYCGGLLSPARAEDAVQQTFLNAYRALLRDDAEIDLRPWLYRIAHNVSLNLLRQNGWDYDELHENMDGVERPDQAFERREGLRQTIESVKALPDRQREAVVLQAVEGRSHEEIAATLGLTDGAVRQLLHRARTTLRRAAAAVTPLDLVHRLTTDANAMTIAQRIPELTAGTAAGAGAAKVAVAVLAAGTIAGGAVSVAPVDGGGETPAAVAADQEPVEPASEGIAGSPDDIRRREHAAEQSGDRGRGTDQRDGTSERSRSRKGDESRGERRERSGPGVGVKDDKAKRGDRTAPRRNGAGNRGKRRSGSSAPAGGDGTDAPVLPELELEGPTPDRSGSGSGRGGSDPDPAEVEEP